MIKNLIIRTISGAVFVALMIASILFPPYFFGAFFFVISILGLREFYSLTEHIEDVNLNKIIAVLSGGLLFLSSYIHLFLDKNIWGLYVLSIVALFVIELFRKKKDPIKNIAVSLMGNVYVALPLVMMSFIEKINPIYLLAFYVIIWASDTGAYLTGMCFGKHKMFERISPKKTWEGLFGGMIFAFVVGFLFSKYGETELSLSMWLIFSFVVFVFGTLGDLVESLFKRTLGVKDSGKLMPGHGGMLDRFDSSLLAAPVAYIFLMYVLN